VPADSQRAPSSPNSRSTFFPDEIELWEGALVEPLAVGLHAIRRFGMQAGDSVDVFGGGPIGLTAVQAAQLAGAKEIFVTEPNDSCREIARQMGTDVAFDPMEDDVATAVTDAADDGVEAAFEFAGIGPAFNAAVQSTRHGGTITVGSISDGEISTDLDDVVTTERRIKGTHCYGFPPISFRSEFDTVIEAFADGKFDTEVFVTDRIPLADIVSDGYERLWTPRRNTSRFSSNLSTSKLRVSDPTVDPNGIDCGQAAPAGLDVIGGSTEILISGCVMIAHVKMIKIVTETTGAVPGKSRVLGRAQQ